MDCPNCDKDGICQNRCVDTIKVQQVSLTAAIAKELSRQFPGLAATHDIMNACIEGADLVCDKLKQVELKINSKKDQ